MNRQVDYDAMRIKIEFAFRVISSTGQILKQKNYREEEIDKIVGLVSSTLVGHIYVHRHSAGTIPDISFMEQANTRIVGLLLAEEFNSLSRKIDEGVEKNLCFNHMLERQEVLIASGCDHIIDVMKKIISGIPSQQTATV